jgi:hypothetical protein
VARDCARLAPRVYFIKFDVAIFCVTVCADAEHGARESTWMGPGQCYHDSPGPGPARTDTCRDEREAADVTGSDYVAAHGSTVIESPW